MGYLDVLFPELARIGEERSPLSQEMTDTLKSRLARRMHEGIEYLATEEAAGVLSALDAQLDSYAVPSEAKQEILTAARLTLDQRVRMMKAEGAALLAAEDSLQASEKAERLRRRHIRGFAGGAVGNGSQLLLGGRLGVPVPWSPIMSFVPEVSLGFFGGATSALVQGSLRYHFIRNGVEPYAGLGLGILILSDELGDRSGSSLVATPTLGIEIPGAVVGDILGWDPSSYFVEYQGIALFDHHRLTFGVGWRY
jgi:hypothetical protein